MKMKIVSFLLVIIILFSLIGCEKSGNSNNTEVAVESQDSEKKKSENEKVVRIAFASSGNFLGELAGIAQENKYIEEELEKVGYKPEYIGFAAAGPAVNEAFVGKSIDFANYGDLPPIVLKSKGLGVSIIGITNSQYNMALVVQNDSTIKSAADIEGKKIIVGKGTVYQSYFNNLIKGNNVKESSVEVINTVADAESTFLAKQANGVVLSDIQARLLVSKGEGKIVESSIEHPEWSNQVVFVGRDEFMKENPEVATALLKSLIRARDFSKENTEETYKILSKSGIPEEIVKDAYEYDDGKFDNYVVEITEKSINKLKKLESFLVEQKLTSSNVKIEDLVDSTYYKKALEELKNKGGL